MLDKICETFYGGPKTWYIYDNYYQMLTDQCSPAFKTKKEAEQECKKRNIAYKALGIKKGDTYRIKKLEGV